RGDGRDDGGVTNGFIQVKIANARDETDTGLAVGNTGTRQVGFGAPQTRTGGGDKVGDGHGPAAMGSRASLHASNGLNNWPSQNGDGKWTIRKAGSGRAAFQQKRTAFDAVLAARV